MKKIIYLLGVLVFTISANAQQTVGLFTQNPGSLDGYVLFAPVSSTTTYLIDKCGYQVHTWSSTHHPGQVVYLLEDGTLLRSANINNQVFNAGGNGGKVERFDWNSNLLWSYDLSSSVECQHHDILQLPNGNVLAIMWESKTPSQAIAQGRNPSLLGTSLWSEKIVELKPIGIDSAEIVWEWHAWDHLVQDYDPLKPNYGNVSQHPELINLNYYTGTATASDWLHCNALDYNEVLDQVILSAHNFSEVWIIDHSTTKTESATHSGGVYGRGGDLMYRWGNPAAYNRGTTADKKLYGQHNPQWIKDGLKDAGNILVFNNGVGRPGGAYSSIEIFTPPLDSSGNYTLVANQPYQPDSSFWKYTAPVPSTLFSQAVSGAQRLSNGNTIICEGTKGNFFEIDSTKNTVWHYISPVGNGGIISQGTAPGMNLVFRCYLYEPDYPGLAGQTLTPGSPIELNPSPYSCTMLTTNVKDISGDATISVKVSNPFTDEIIIFSEKDLMNTTATFIDIGGRTIKVFNDLNISAFNSERIKINSPISNGIYFLNLKSPSNNINVKLIHQ